jgi:hypothetical protein
VKTDGNAGGNSGKKEGKLGLRRAPEGWKKKKRREKKGRKERKARSRRREKKGRKERSMKGKGMATWGL